MEAASLIDGSKSAAAAVPSMLPVPIPGLKVPALVPVPLNPVPIPGLKVPVLVPVPVPVPVPVLVPVPVVVPVAVVVPAALRQRNEKITHLHCLIVSPFCFRIERIQNMNADREMYVITEFLNYLCFSFF
jgi:hypothetical protein